MDKSLPIKLHTMWGKKPWKPKASGVALVAATEKITILTKLK